MIQLNRDVTGAIPVYAADVRLGGDHESLDLIILVSERAPLLDVLSSDRTDACLLISEQITHEEVILAFDRNWR